MLQTIKCGIHHKVSRALFCCYATIICGYATFVNIFLWHCYFLLTMPPFLIYIEIMKGVIILNKRFKSLRQTLDLTQQEFADKLGIVRNNVACYETGKRSPSDAVVSLVCKTFNVNENWLRTGVGPMFLDLPEEDETAAIVATLLDPDKEPFFNVIVEIMKSYQSLSPNSKQAINELADNILKNLNKKREG